MFSADLTELGKFLARLLCTAISTGLPCYLRTSYLRTSYLRTSYLRTISRDAFRCILVGACISLLLALAVQVWGVEQPGFVYRGVFDGQALVDPTRPASWHHEPAQVKKSVQRPKVHIDFIIHSRQRKMVSINGDQLQEGDQWQEIRIVSIEPKRVLLAWRGQRWFSSVNPGRGNQRKNMSIRRWE